MRERKPIDPALRRLLDEQAVNSGNLAAMNNQERVQMVRSMLVRSLESRASIPGLPNEVEMQEVAIAPDLAARLYRPPGAARLPVLVYLHGGGWVAGSVATHDPFCRLLSQAAEIIAISVEYRLAPEHPYPAAVEDALTAIQWTIEKVADWGGDSAQLALGGDSAGANLAAVVANQLCATVQADVLRALLLLYPVTDHPIANHASYIENATGYGLEADTMHWFWKQYAPDVSPNNSNVSPLQLQKVLALPPTLVATAEYDVLRDEGIAYAEKLAMAGIAVTHLHAPDMNHNFVAFPGTVRRFPQSNATLAQISQWLQAVLRSKP
ncbi:MAG TPA: alpha/beta hydrolase [Allocoleopsis sp.]